LQLVQQLKKISDESIFVHDNGMHKLWMTRFFHAEHPNQVVIDNALATMASGISQGIVAKLLYPEKDVYVNIGDGGLLMSLGELATAASLNVDLKIIVWHDNEYGMIKWHQQKNNLPHFGISVKTPDLSLLAQSFGGKGFEVTSAENLEQTLRKAQKSSGLSVIDCPIDYSENVKTFSSQHYSFNQKYAAQ
jgi:acetolactate synthase-1/2/3 large subunit